MPRGLGAMMAGGDAGNRNEDDFYATGRGPVESLMLSGWGPDPTKQVWEPACGTGEMAESLRMFGIGVLPTDLIERGYGLGGMDYTTMDVLLAEQVVTNPPFSLAVEFLEAWERQGGEYLALLLKATWWHAAERTPLFRRLTPAAVLPLTYRMDFNGKGRPTMELIWVVWRRGHQGLPAYDLLGWPEIMYGPRRNKIVK